VTPRTLAEVAGLVGGRLADTDGAPVVTDVVLDSRATGPGSLFAALPGERADGHDFAATSGAGGVLTTRPVGVPAVVVTDVVAALGRLAHGVLAALPDVTVVGVTGSAGKTTTKDLLAALLARIGPTVAAPGSFNNELGLPLTVLRCDETTRHLVLEYGARGVGHIAGLTEVAAPDIAVVLNVGSAHLGEFGSRAAIAQAKGELVEAARALAVLNADDPLVLAMRDRAREFTLFGAADGTADGTADGIAGAVAVGAHDVRLDDGGRAWFVLSGEGAGSAPVRLRLVGEHQVSNALAAATVALDLGLGIAEVAEVLSTTEPASPHRMAVHRRADGVTVVDDAYNANPESVRAALKALVSMTGAGGRRAVAVLGEMRELGPDSDEAHMDLGRLAVRLDVRVVTVGDPATPIGRLHAGAVLEGSWGTEAVHVADVDEALAHLRAELRPGDVVLVKASRSVGLERVVDGLLG